MVESKFPSSLNFCSLTLSWFLPSSVILSEPVRTCSLLSKIFLIWCLVCTPNFIHTVSLLGSKWEKKKSIGFTSWLKVHFFVDIPMVKILSLWLTPLHAQSKNSWNALWEPWIVHGLSETANICSRLKFYHSRSLLGVLPDPPPHMKNTGLGYLFCFLFFVLSKLQITEDF